MKTSQRYLVRFFAAFFVLFTLIAGGLHRHVLVSSSAVSAPAPAHHHRHHTTVKRSARTVAAVCALCEWLASPRAAITTTAIAYRAPARHASVVFATVAAAVFDQDVPHRGLRGPPVSLLSTLVSPAT